MTIAKSTLPEYHVYRAMLLRCNNADHKQYKNYGGRGITICDHWQKDFWNFYADMGQKPKVPGQRYSIDRIDNNGNYEPHNCRWATDEEQARNKRHTVHFTYNGVTLSSQEWAMILGCEIPALTMRRKRGWSDERIITTPIQKQWSIRKEGSRVRGPTRGRGLYDAWTAYHLGGGDAE
ncbi:hypothetical protein ACFZ8E_07445 [Methylobacterium sp. HMF5984]|uniref:hypothetical protein n=1 Tax=Methylobacterium sp. HMF5984 TaxID=3367370 RepID=UPI0038531CB3